MPTGGIGVVHTCEMRETDGGLVCVAVRWRGVGECGYECHFSRNRQWRAKTTTPPEEAGVAAVHDVERLWARQSAAQSIVGLRMQLQIIACQLLR